MILTTIAEIAAFCECSESTINRCIANGEMPAPSQETQRPYANGKKLRYIYTPKDLQGLKQLIAERKKRNGTPGRKTRLGK